MKKSIFFTCLSVLLIPTIGYLTFHYFYPAHPQIVGDLQKITAADEYSEYFDKTKVLRKENALIEITSVKNYFKEQLTDSDKAKYRSAKTDEVVDCKNLSVAPISVTVYSDEFGRGKVVDGPVPINFGPMTFEAGSMGAAKIKHICNMS